MRGRERSDRIAPLTTRFGVPCAPMRVVKTFLEGIVVTVPSAAVLYVLRNHVAVGAFVTALVAVLLLAVVYHWETKTSGSGGNMDRDDTPKVVVLSLNQQGGQTAHTIVNQAPKPTVALGKTLSDNEPDNAGHFHSRAEIVVTSPYPAANLYVEAHGASVESVELMPQRGGSFMTGHAGKREGFAFNNLQSPQGVIHIDVVSSRSEARIAFVARVE
jgi:hypothetical protein